MSDRVKAAIVIAVIGPILVLVVARILDNLLPTLQLLVA